MRSRLLALWIAALLPPGAARAQDVDGDGVDAALDCDDNDPNNFPGNAEVCDGRDNDCSGAADFGGVQDLWVQDSGNPINNANYTKGNVFLAAQSTVITAVGMRLDVGAGATLTLTVGEGSSSSGPFTIVSTTALGAVPSGAQVHTGTGLSVNVTPGNYYWVGATWSGATSTNYYDSSGAAADPAWGSFVTGAWDGTGSAPTTGWSPASLPSGAYDMEIATGLAVGVEEDLDGDGYFNCEECDDADPAIHPGAVELCDGVDNDCDGAANAPGGEADADGDGYLGCEECDDSRPSVYPGALELCDGLDNDCNGLADADAAGEVDADGDGSLSCADCDDNDFAVSPDRFERCDGVDNDCNGVADAPGGEEDADGDGFLACEDCDDADADSFPFAPERCDGADNDCNGVADYDGPGSEVDEDLDGAFACEDCDDADPDTWPGAPELCDGVDNDCDGADPSVEQADQDGDGVAICAGDCNDVDPAVAPAAAELCDGLDNDCDGEVDEGACDAPLGEVKDAGGCGCATGSGPSWGWMALSLLAAARRRG